MTTTPETIAELKRLYAKKGLTEIDRLVLLMSVGGLVTDIEAAQKREQVLRDELARLRDVVSAVEHDSIDAALADTEVQP